MKPSELARAIDPRLTTHRWVIAVAILGGVVGFCSAYLRSGDPSGALWSATLAGLATFLAWAIAREVDPDCERSAFAGPAITILAWILLPPDAPLLGFWLLLAVRIVNRTVGVPANYLDLAGFLGLSAWLAYGGFAPVAWLAPIALLLDGRLSPRSDRSFYAGVVAAIAAIATAWITRPALAGWQVLPTLVGALGLGLFLMHLPRLRELRSVVDSGTHRMLPHRVRAGAWLSVAFLTLHASFLADRITALIPIWAAVAGVGCYHGLLPRRLAEDAAEARDRR